ncbi:S8 family serine peptidase [Peribacillus sp. SCS-155]|uniref:S8 family serine peptidase n=1 Tax=Peribacillus sedimenti TaxID=3115297 RepID=UPI003905D8A8
MKKKPLLPLIAALAISLSGNAAVNAKEIDFSPKASPVFNKAAEFADQELVIRFKSGIAKEEKLKIMSKVQGKELDKQSRGNFSLVSVPKGTDLKQAAAALMDSKSVDFVEPNYQLQAQYTPADPFYSKQWYLNKIGMPKAWDTSRGTSDVVVAVVDGGIQTSHPELSGKVYRPYNSITGGKTVPPDDHGTHVAGIIAASSDNKGTTGIAPNVKIMPVNVFDGEYADAYFIADGIIYAVDSGADIVNVSLTTDEYPAIVDYAVKYAADHGVLIVAAAGNEGVKKLQYPAALNSVLGVSAVDSLDKITAFSNFGTYIDFAAPGLNIYSTVSKSSYHYMSGTSMASPVVSAISALILSKNPFLTPNEVTNILKASAVDLGTAGRDSQYGYGRVNASDALVKTPAPLSPVTLSDKTLIENGTNKANISFDAPKNTKVSLYVQNSQGKIVRHLIKDKPWSGGTVSFAWDGKLGSNAYAPDSRLKIVAKAVKKSHTRLKGTYLSVDDQIVPEINFSGSPVTFSPAVKGKVTIPFYVNKNVAGLAEIRDTNGNVVKSLFTDKPFFGGNRLLEWDGKNTAGARVKDGKYTVHLSMKDKDGRTAPEAVFPITIDTAAPKAAVSNSTSIFKMDGKTKITANIRLFEQTKLSVNVVNSKGTIVQKLVSGKTFSGNVTSSWFGKTLKNVYASDGSYHFQITLADPSGNTRVINVTPFKLINLRK